MVAKGGLPLVQLLSEGDDAGQEPDEEVRVDAPLGDARAPGSRGGPSPESSTPKSQEPA